MITQTLRQLLAGTRCAVQVARAHPVKSGLVIGLSGAGFYFTSPRNIYLEAPKVVSGPSSGSTDFEQHASLSSLSSLVVLEKLRQNEESHVPERGSGIARYDVAYVASNHPIEDAHCEATLPVPSGFWSLFAVLDGHNGWQTSAWLRERIIPAVVGAIADVYTKYQSEPTPGDVQRPKKPPSEIIDGAIKDTFKRLDDEIVHDPLEKVFSTKSKAAAIEHLALAHAGSCALLALYDSQDRSLRIALTGDSRAVLGRRTSHPAARASTDDGHDEKITLTEEREGDFYEAHVLSIDQNGKNATEEVRMNALHPGEKLFAKGRVLGWGISRAFGDAAYKWSLDIQERLAKEYLCDWPRKEVQTPPYFTAEPEVTTMQVKPGDFLILATDGLWDELTNEAAVGLVGLWLNDQRRNNASTVHVNGDSGLSSSHDATTEPEQLPVTLGQDGTYITKKRFLNVDGNVATHLIRNALGGADSDLIAALLKMTPPRARRHRDDITVIVVFFGDDKP